MSIEKTNFISYFQNESSFYGDISDDQHDLFNNWITFNFIELEKIDTIEKVLPSEKIINDFKSIGYIHLQSQCHYSAKAVCILNSEFEFWTGFIVRESTQFPIVTHSFNRNKCKIIDFSILGEDNNPLNYNTSFPRIYYGIKIPREFVIKFEEETFKYQSMKPLLIEWFKCDNQ